MSRVSLIILLLVLAAANPAVGRNFPSIQTRMIPQRLTSLSSLSSPASTEFVGVTVTGQAGDQAMTTITVNPARLLSQKLDSFHGYREFKYPWLIDLNLGITVPAQDADGKNLAFLLKWSWYPKASWYSRHWDSYFDEVHAMIPQWEDEADDDWSKRIREKTLVGATVDSLMRIEASDGFALSFSGLKEEGKWEKFAFDLVGSYHLGSWITALDASAEIGDDSHGQLTAQFSRELWPGRWESGAMVFSAAITGEYADDWGGVSTASVTLPIMKQAQVLLAYQVKTEGSRILTGFNYQFFPASNK